MRGLKMAVIGIALAWPGIAQAAIFDFSLSGDYSASWQLDTTEGPFSHDARGFTFAGVAGGFPEAGSLGVDLDFADEESGGGLRITDAEEGTILAWLGGSPLFDGDTAAPRFREGRFTLTGIMDGADSTLVIRNVTAAAVPEPATWAMMLAGFGLSGAAIRRRRMPLAA